MKLYQLLLAGIFVTIAAVTAMIFIVTLIIAGCGSTPPIEPTSIKTCFDTPDGEKCVTVENPKSESKPDSGLIFIDSAD